MSDSLRLRGLQHTRLSCPSPITPGVCSDSCPLSPWWHPTISSSVVPFSSCLQSFPASGSFPMNQFFASGGQSIGVSAGKLHKTRAFLAPVGRILSAPPRFSEERNPLRVDESLGGPRFCLPPPPQPPGRILSTPPLRSSPLPLPHPLPHCQGRV